MVTTAIIRQFQFIFILRLLLLLLQFLLQAQPMHAYVTLYFFPIPNKKSEMVNGGSREPKTNRMNWTTIFAFPVFYTYICSGNTFIRIHRQMLIEPHDSEIHFYANFLQLWFAGNVCMLVCVCEKEREDDFYACMGICPLTYDNDRKCAVFIIVVLSPHILQWTFFKLRFEKLYTKNWNKQENNSRINRFTYTLSLSGTNIYLFRRWSIEDILMIFE